MYVEKPDPPADTRADAGRAFFVSVIDRARNRHALLAGPYDTFGQAKEQQTPATRKAEPGDPFNEYAYGVCQAPADSKALFGVL